MAQKITAEQIAAIARQLAEIAAVFNPGAAASVVAVIEVGTELNNLIKDIRLQENGQEAAVWAEVRDDYAESLDAFNAAASAHAID